MSTITATLRSTATASTTDTVRALVAKLFGTSKNGSSAPATASDDAWVYGARGL
jgi:hypothetical protein